MTHSENGLNDPARQKSHVVKRLRVVYVNQAGTTQRNEGLTYEKENWFFAVTRIFHAPSQTRRAQPHNRLIKPWL
jgi:hypothetical protein